MKAFGPGLAVICLLASATALACIVIPTPPHPPRPIILPQPQPSWLECREQHVTFEIDHPVARVKVVTTLFNPHNHPVEGQFIFPIPPGATVTKFQFTVGGKLTTGEILPAKKAREIYLNYVRATRDPALLEYSGFAMFTAKIFPVPPRTERKISLEYMLTLKPDHNLVRLFHNLKLGREHLPESAKLVIEGHIHSAVPITTVFSPTHEIDVVRKSPNDASFSLELNKHPFDRDFVLCYGVSKSDLGIYSLVHRSPGEDGYFLLALAPPVPEGKKSPPKDVVLVLDTSGSMKGEKIDQAKRALDYALKSLSPRDHFDLISFATMPRPLDDKLLRATPDNIERARKYVDNLEAVGGTALNDALVSAFKTLNVDDTRPRYVLFFTDGMPTVGERNEGRILKNVAAANKSGDGRRGRLFILGVGYDVNTRLLDSLAQGNGGVSGYVRPGEDLEIAISSLVDKIGHPVLTDLKLAVSGAETADLHPVHPPDLFRGDQLLVVGRYTEPGEADFKLSGKIDGSEARSFSWHVKLPERDRENDFLPRLWATRQIGYLLDQIRLNGESAELKHEVVRLALKFGIVTPYTSYLVQEAEPRLADTFQHRPGLRAATARPGAGGTMGPGGPAGSFYRMSPEATARAGAGMMGAMGGGVAAVDAAQATQAMRATVVAAPVPSTGGPQSAPTVKTIAGKVFYYDAASATWIDSEYDSSAKDYTVAYFSDLYFDLIARRPDIARWLAVGEKAKIRVGKAQLYVAPHTTETLTEDMIDGFGS